MAKPNDLVLNVPYYSQRESHTDEASRMCFSASMSMCAEFLKPGCIKGNYELKEDDYLELEVHKYGDSTNYLAQLKALADYGIKAHYSQTGNWAQVDAQLVKGRPVGIGILHHGVIGQKLYGGHWMVIIGKEAGTGNYIVNDPYGELDLVNGVYISADGLHKRYSSHNLGLRWMADGSNSGWMVTFE